MSDATHAALEAAIVAHIADEADSLATGWILVTETTTLDQIDNRQSSFFIEAPAGQSMYTGDGLLFNALHMPREHSHD